MGLDMRIFWTGIVIAVLFVAAGLALLLTPPVHGKGDSREGPVYEVVRNDGNFEIRDYEGYIAAQTEEGASDYKSATYAGFMKLFGYISGGNTNRSKLRMTTPVTQEQADGPEKIPMTAPVTSEKTTGSRYVISFIMPGDYTLDTLPVPDDKTITFRKIDAHRAAVVRFPGRMNEKMADSKTAELRDWMMRNGLEAKSGFVTAQYDPPWTPGFMRRNEVMVQV
jgi:hypothetical protein